MYVYVYVCLLACVCMSVCMCIYICSRHNVRTCVYVADVGTVVWTGVDAAIGAGAVVVVVLGGGPGGGAGDTLTDGRSHVIVVGLEHT